MNKESIRCLTGLAVISLTGRVLRADSLDITLIELGVDLGKRKISDQNSNVSNSKMRRLRAFYFQLDFLIDLSSLKYPGGLFIGLTTGDRTHRPQSRIG